ncbi:MAG TPA: ABC transporter ATP-binding protein [Coriobacteriia bacterium]|nr:ABC transporter ATP-binding protein [Coriobacteriia bacterium]
MSETTASAPAAIIIEGARKDYGAQAGGRREAVSDVSLCVTQGAIHGLLGPNGAGKTTTLKMLLGLVRPSGGTFEVLGVDAHKPGARAQLGFLPEQPYFPIQLTVIEALTLYGRLAGLTKTQVAAEAPALLERVGLGGQAKTRLSRFSRGMLQRLGLAQAMLGSPKVVVLDEPASGLDPVGQRDIRNLMLELRGAGTSILLSSHQLSEVETVCDEVTILNRGLVAARGHIDDLLSVAGQAAITARGDGDLPEAVAGRVVDTAFSGATVSFSVAESDVRAVVDALDDAGWTLLAVSPKRDSLEDYFARMLGESVEEGGAR